MGLYSNLHFIDNCQGDFLKLLTYQGPRKQCDSDVFYLHAITAPLTKQLFQNRFLISDIISEILPSA